jgi:fumarate reductase flavoprotein subunit
MKKGRAFFACLLIVALALSCSTQAKPGEGYKPGTYTGSARGMNGEVVLDVSFSADAILSITVKDHRESPGISDPAFERIPQAIIANQSLGIDTVSGCTISSNAILNAVASAVEQAGGNPALLRTRQVARQGPGAAIERTVDIIVIGGGGAGIAASASALENGASSLILLEKTAALGGNTLASGLAMNASDREAQGKMNTLPGQLDTLRAILNYREADFGAYGSILRELQGQVRQYLAGDSSRMFDSVEWHIIQSYLGGKRTDRNGQVVENKFELLTTLCRESLETFKWLGNTVGIELSDYITSPVGSMWMRGHNFASKPGVFSASRAYIERKGGEIMLETKAESLIVENGRVTGVRAVKADGAPVVLYGRKGVIITTGGFGANPQMVAQYNTYWPAIPPGIKTTCVASAAGDGIVLGLGAGAALTDMGMIQLMPTAGIYTGALEDGLLVAPQNYLFVNKEGRRFVNEYAERDVLATAALSQTDGMFFTIADQEMAKTVQNRATQEQIDQMVAEGKIYKADTLAGLAASIGCAPSVFEETIRAFNRCVETGQDPEFGKNAFEMRIQTPPFYACPSRPAVHHTMGGLSINKNAEVLSGSGAPIPGLYAAGEVTGGVHGGNRLGGNAIADIMVFGRIAGARAASR